MEILNIPCHRIWYNTQISCWACRFLGHEAYHSPNHDALVIQSSDYFFFIIHLQTSIPLYTSEERLPVRHSHAVFPLLGSTGSLSATARRVF